MVITQPTIASSVERWLRTQNALGAGARALKGGHDRLQVDNTRGCGIHLGDVAGVVLEPEVIACCEWRNR